MTVSQNISVTVTTDTADTDEAVENRIKAILTELLPCAAAASSTN